MFWPTFCFWLFFFFFADRPTLLCRTTIDEKHKNKWGWPNAMRIIKQVKKNISPYVRFNSIREHPPRQIPDI